MSLTRFAIGATLAATMVLGACGDDNGTEPTDEVTDDYALVMFGEPGVALTGTLGEQPAQRAYDGRTGDRELPPALQLTTEQRAAITALREAFKAANQADLDAMRAVFEQARAAREGGATREKVRAILEGGRPIGERLRANVRALHDAINAVLTPAQREFLRRNRPNPPRPITRGTPPVRR
jgi:Spy/CpxP family protein refolding chaperone